MGGNGGRGQLKNLLVIIGTVVIKVSSQMQVQKKFCRFKGKAEEKAPFVVPARHKTVPDGFDQHFVAAVLHFLTTSSVDKPL